MRTLRTHRRLATWLAALADFFGALSPAISHVVSSSRGVSWIEVCSAQGAKLVSGGAAQDREAPPVAEHVLEHCPYCSIHMPALGVPPSAAVQPLRLDLRDQFPIAFLAAARTLHAWVSAQPRAPPLNS